MRQVVQQMAQRDEHPFDDLRNVQAIAEAHLVRRNLDDAGLHASDLHQRSNSPAMMFKLPSAATTSGMVCPMIIRPKA